MPERWYQYNIPDRLVLELGKGGINFNSNIHKLILLAPSFVFNPASHGTYAEVISGTNYELPTANGYTVGGFTLSPIYNTTYGGYWYCSANINSGDGADAVAGIDWNPLVINATGNLSFGHFIIYDDTHADDIVIKYFKITDLEPITEGEYAGLDQEVASPISMVNGDSLTIGSFVLHFYTMQTFFTGEE